MPNTELEARRPLADVDAPHVAVGTVIALPADFDGYEGAMCWRLAGAISAHWNFQKGEVAADLGEDLQRLPPRCHADGLAQTAQGIRQGKRAGGARPSRARR